MGMEFVTWYMICGTWYTVHGRSTAILEKILVTDCENRECSVTRLVLVLTGMMKGTSARSGQPSSNLCQGLAVLSGGCTSSPSASLVKCDTSELKG